ncbi:UDP-4-amino-4,6-dideoxy-N-acetyl-beta-L-altrosamine N-acetyltransferase [Pseudomonas sp. 102515]|uniref:UDP-4-amino-4, 6-dideoxy-N-acetyl-beta-L-altrosamine N-acetyltransferase n=1 Tax=Pseudomonas sp. 102515 TaxID=3071568 RepID=UPI002800AB26|nr:UDP-4-amino-4,6-dideoxy-N-acetyl-beta-L-altrosamine N-acetyltransferase [Pseudomonas sp. 102515]MDQ7912463.1 UDP-4-amino-4,6-dideoxy-N-acetyl-beta-L-altrosamine N-acetyltransferase [Pseudomonas sp. 102515]
MQTDTPALRLGDFALRPVQFADAALILRWRNTPSVRQTMYSTGLIGEVEHHAWLKRELGSPQSRHFLFTCAEQAVGYACLSEIRSEHRRCTWGFNLGDSVQPRGTGSRMLFLLAEVAFEQLQLDKLWAEVLDFNVASLRVHTRLGFQEEGQLLRHVHRPDGVFDVVRLALFAEQWQATRSVLREKLFYV